MTQAGGALDGTRAGNALKGTVVGAALYETATLNAQDGTGR